MKSNFEQFVNRDNTPEQSEKQTAEEPARLTKEEIMEKVQEALFPLFFPLEGRYGSMLMDVLDAENVSTELKPYVLRELNENPKYAAESILELIDPVHGERKLSLLDLAIETAKGKKREHDRKKPIVKEVPARLYSPSLRQNQYSLTTKCIYKYDEDGNVHDINTQGELFNFLRIALSVMAEQQNTNGFIKMDINGIAKSIGYKDLRHFAGSSRLLSQEQARQSIITKIEKMFVGVRGHFPQEPSKQYQVMVFDHENTTEGTIVFYSPYIKHLFEMYRPTPQKDNKGKIHSSYHRLIEKTALRYDPNGIAVEMLNIVCSGLVQAGEKHSYRVALKTILERSPLAQARLAEAQTSSHRTKILKKITKDLSVLLAKHTRIQEDYQNVKITMPPVVSFRTLDDFQICIQHDGKKKVAPFNNSNQ